MKRKLVAILLPLLACWIGVGSASAADLQIADSDFGAGYVTLAWPDLQGQSFILEGNDGTGWTELYDGSNRASTLTGLPNGDYRYRVKSNTGASTEPLKVTITHHPLSQALSFFGAGAVVFLILLAVLFNGPRDRDLTA